MDFEGLETLRVPYIEKAFKCASEITDVLDSDNTISSNALNREELIRLMKNSYQARAVNSFLRLPGALGLSAPNQPNTMPPPKFLQGYKVTLIRDKTKNPIVWTVHHHEDRVTAGNIWERVYYLEADQDKTTRENERDIQIYDQVTAQKKTKVDFDTVIIEAEKRAQILEALEQINQSDLIFNEWGFGDTIEKGRGVSMLFYGPPGTGKTLMAQALANKLDYVLKIISTADIESSAPGEAERNIRKHFAEAKEGKTILLFDECDSLIYTRANVGPIMAAQINELLSQIERFDGITLFTTNRLGTLDEAVNRRLALKLEFTMPTLEQRAEIWQRMFPKKCPIDNNVDWIRLAIVEISGGYIKNAVLRAARMAAIEKLPDNRKKIRMQHLVKALRLETESMLEFQNARAENEGRYGRVNREGVNVATGHRVVHTIDKVKKEAGKVENAA
jgi:AAA+ superfamily predicted ATPase